MARQRLDILVNDAGIFIGGPVEEATIEQADHRIITIGSALADHVPIPGMTLYAMAKSALTGMTRGLARDLGPRGITAAVVHAGLIDTDMNPADGPAASFLSSIPALGRFGTGEDIAAAVAHLAGDGGRYVTGMRDSSLPLVECHQKPRRSLTMIAVSRSAVMTLLMMRMLFTPLGTP